MDPVSRENAYILAITHGLSFDDASYLELAYCINAPLITADKALQKAALETNVKLDL